MSSALNKKIVCYFWVNRLNPNESIELIDNIELFFNDDTSVVITCNEDGNGLEILNDFNYEEEKNQLKPPCPGNWILYRHYQ